MAVTLTPRAGPRGRELTKLLRLFPGTVAIPPLRHHIEDLHELVPFFLARLGHGGALTCSPEAMQLLLRAQLAGQRRAGLAGPRAGRAAPPDRRDPARRPAAGVLDGQPAAGCHPLESMERDAIVQSLLDTRGNKVKAAEALGMSRATIYRKIHEYGIVSPV